MVTNHQLWPVISLISGVIYLDTAGREVAKNLSFQHEGIKVGTNKERRVFITSYIMMAVIAIIVIMYSINTLVKLL